MIALRADLLDFTAAPAWGEPTMHGVRWRPDHWLCIDPAGGGGGPAAGRIVDVRPGHEDPGPGWRRLDHRGRLRAAGLHRHPCAQRRSWT
jgi:guanine deaminase